MLKVVGASWEQTRATSYILILFTFCGLLIIIFGGSMTLSEVDGNYSASVFWQKEVGYRIEFWGQGNVLSDLPRGVARGYYRQDIANNGWSKIEIETNNEFADEIQAYAAGLLEGSLTWQLLFFRWKNTIEAACEARAEECENIRNRLSDWGDRMRAEAADQSSLDPFWHQINLFFYQLDGLITGWNYSIRRNRSKHMEISNADFLWLQLLATDLPLPDHPSLVPQAPSLTSAIIKLHRKVNKPEGVTIGQTTAAPYRDMLRMVKRYMLAYRMTDSEGSGQVPGGVLEFTGYPGALSSQDDLYLVGGRTGKHSLVVVGSTIGVGVSGTVRMGLRSRNGRKKRNIEEKVPGTIRALVASRLARGGRTWAAYFTRGRGGASIDKQWSVVDLGKLSSEESGGLLWVVEQSGGVIATSDLTEVFRERSYWACDGLPHHQELRLAMNVSGEGSSTRREVFDRCYTGCEERDEVYQLIRLPVPATQELTGGRPDLYPDHPLPFGVIDTKIISGTKSSRPTLEVTAGPVHAANTSVTEEPPSGSASPFQWSTSAYFLSVPHFGHPDIWSFQPHKAEWIY